MYLYCQLESDMILHMKFFGLDKDTEKESHTCEDGGGTPQNFLLAFIDEL